METDGTENQSDPRQDGNGKLTEPVAPDTVPSGETGHLGESSGVGDGKSFSETGKADEKASLPGDTPEDSAKEEEGQGMGLLDHLGELRSRLVKAALGVAVGFGVCWYYVDFLFTILTEPLLQALPAGTHAQYTTLPEAFFIRMEIAFIGALFVASPVIFYQIWAFIAPGLYDEEKRHIIPIALLSAIFFSGGAVFCYYIVFPFAFNFFIGYSTPEIVVTPKISDYINFVLKLLFAFGIIFEMPIFTLFLSRMGILTAKMMRKGRKYAIVGIFIIAAILTPPDVVSQLLMACPMLALYELSIGVAAIFGRKPEKEADAQ